MKKIILCLFFVLFNILSTWGQVDIGTGVQVQRFPLGNYYGYERSASLYTAEEVIGIGNISVLHWYVTSPNNTIRPVVIYLKEIDEDQLTAVAWDEIISGATKVYEDMFTPALGWNGFELTTPFNFTGTKNLLVLVEANYGGGGDSNGINGVGVRYTEANGRHMWMQRDRSIPDGNGTINGNRPNIRIQIPLQGCVVPMAPQITSLGSDVARFSITLRTSDPTYEYELRNSGEPGSGAQGLVQSGMDTAVNLVLSNLTQNSTYVLYIRARCDGTETSNWVSVQFETLSDGQIGHGERRESNLPIQALYGYNYSQQIYLAQEVLDAVGDNRYITKIKFHFSLQNGETSNFKDWKIFMGNTTKNSFESTASTEWVSVDNMFMVFDGEVTFPNPTGDWMEIDLIDPFLWDGTSNVVVGVHEYTPGYTFGASFRVFPTDMARGMLYRDDDASNNPDPNNPPTAFDRFEYVPQIILDGEQVPDCIGVYNRNYRDLTDTSVKISWGNNFETVQQTEYYLATSPQPPTADAIATAVVDASVREVSLSDLTPDTRYYVWFRNVCQHGQISSWSRRELVFKTLIIGQIGQGDRVLDALPIRSSSNYNYSQQIYLADEIHAALPTNNYITGIKFHINARDSEQDQAKYKDWTIYLGHTSKEKFESLSATEWVPTSLLDMVYSGSVTFPDPTNDWMEIVFTEPFLWDQTSNIILAVHENTPQGGTFSGVAQFKVQQTDNERGMVYRASRDLNIDVLPNPTARYKAVSQIILNATPPPPCTPLTGGYEYTDLTRESVKFNWINPQQIVGVEYYLSTTYDIVDENTQALGQVLSPNNQLFLQDLENGTTYYIWFRVVCNTDSRSDWSIVPVIFETLYVGQIGSGNLRTAFLPLDSSDSFNYSQQIYLANEVLAAVGENRYIDKIKFHFSSHNESESYRDWRIFMGNTAKESFEGTAPTEWVAVGDMKIVYNGAVIFPNPTGNWMEITLEEPFLWDGTSNVVVGVHEYSPGSESGASFKRMDTGNVHRGLLARTSVNAILVDPYNSPSGTNRYTHVPQIILNGREVPSCVGVSTFAYSHVGFNTADLFWTNLISGFAGTEYFLRTASEQAPSDNSLPTGMVLPGINQISLSNLQSDTEYYVWFRNRCTATENSAWSGVPLYFKTHIEGLITDGGTTTNNYLPLYSLYSYNYSQQLYLKSELQSVLGNDGRKYITKLRFHVNIPSYSIFSRYQDWNIFIGNTDKNSFERTAATEWVPTTALRQVFDGQVSFPNPTNDWMEITLQDPFVWDGESNLVIAVNEYSPNYSSGAVFRTMNTTGKRGMIHYTDSGRQDINNLPNANFDLNYVPQLFLVAEAVPECLPPTAVSALDVERYSATINWQPPFEGVPQNGYEYEIRTEGLPESGNVGFVRSDVVQNTVLSRIVTDLSPATTYTIYFRARCAGRILSPWTIGVSFTTVCEYPDFEVAGADQLCGQGIVDLSVIVTGVDGNFKWYDVPEGGDVLGEGHIFTTPTITETKSFWVEGSIEAGGELCLSPSGRKMVTVVVTQGMPFRLSESDLSICEGDYTSNVAYLGDLSIYDTYTWSPATGVSGDVQRGWVFNPTSTTEYTLTAKQNSGDFCEYARRVTVNVTALPVVKVTPDQGEIILCKDEVLPIEVDFIQMSYSVIIGEGESLTGNTEEISAFSNRRRSVKGQLLFQASELLAKGIGAGGLESVSFNISSLGDASSNANYTMRIAKTNLTRFETANYQTTGFTTVYGPVSYTHTASGWQEIIFDTPYEWDGVSNLIIEFSHLGDDRLYNAETYFTTTANNTLLFGYNDNSPVLSSKRFNVKFKGGTDYDLEWFPTDRLFVDEDTRVPYLYDPETPLNKVYYKGSAEGYEQLFLNVKGSRECVLSKTFDIRTVVIGNAQASSQEFCGSVSVSDLVASGQDGASFNWYRNATGGMPLDVETAITSGTYFVTEFIGHCESDIRVPVDIVVRPEPNAPVVRNNAACVTGTLADLQVNYDASNVLNWYDASQNLIANNIPVEEGSYYVSQSSQFCESDRIRVEVLVGSTPDAPRGITEQHYCATARVSDLELEIDPTAVVRWYTSMESTVWLPSHLHLQTGTYYGVQSIGGCESSRLPINVFVVDAITIPIVQNQNICSATATVAQLQVIGLPGATINWYNFEQGGLPLDPNQEVVSGLYYVSQKIGDCESDRVRVGINIIENNTAPNVQAQSFCGEAKVRDLHVVIGTGYITKWYTQQEGGIALDENTDLQTGTYYVSQSIYYCESPRNSVVVVVDPLPATPTGDEIQEIDSVSAPVIGDLQLNEPNIIWFSSEEDALNNINRLSIGMPLIDGEFYYGVVESENGCLSLPFKVQARIKLGLSTFELKDLSYYPNPVKDVLTLTYREVITKVEVYTLKGQRVLTMNTADKQLSVNMGHLASAVYMVKIYTENHVQFVKVIKQ